jgi:CRP/FNR family transcriptional regulator
MFEQMAFGHFGMRLARHLLTLAGDADTLELTHEKLASELGTDRVVVSRTLKDFEHAGMVACHRGRLDVVRPALAKYIDLHPL